MRIVRGKASIFDEPMKQVQNRMANIDPNSREYTLLLSHLGRMARLQNEEKSNRVSRDTIALVAGNLVGILIIVGYEHGHVIGTRALNFILRARN